MITSQLIKIPKEYKTIIELAQSAIEDKHLLKFFYESKPTNKNKDGNKDYRTIRPYMLIPRNENLELVGVPVTELSKPVKDRQAGHYTIAQLKERFESEQFQTLPETFDDPGVERRIVVLTQTSPLFRFIYNDENAKEVKSEWLRIRYV